MSEEKRSASATAPQCPKHPDAELTCSECWPTPNKGADITRFADVRSLEIGELGQVLEGPFYRVAWRSGCIEVVLANRLVVVRAGETPRPSEAPPDLLAGDPGKWPCKCGRRMSECPCWADGVEHGLAMDPRPSDAPAEELVKALRVQESRVSGALCDAATVDTNDHEKGIRELTEERDAYRSALADMVSVTGDHLMNHTGIRRRHEAIDLLRTGVRRERAKP